MKYAELLQINSIVELPQEQQINIIGNLFDLSFDNSNLKGIEHAFVLSDQIEYEGLTLPNKILYHYDLSNGWSYLKQIKYQDRQELWDFQLQEITKIIFNLRKAISIEGFEDINPIRKCQIYTNLGNTFSFIGRCIEAQESWNKALEIIPDFVMAMANKGYGLYFYRQYLFDNSHKTIFGIYSGHYIHLTIDDKEKFEPGAWQFFSTFYNDLKKHLSIEDIRKPPNLNEFSLGNNKRLKNYRKWALKNILYINPINDLGNFTSASHDCLNLSHLVFEINSPPIYFTLYNQIKQEYGTARFIYYESIQRYKPHYSDTDIVILETGEAAKYSYYVEQLKISYKLAYSTLDKIAFLLNDYLKLGIPQNEVSFRSLWYEKKTKDKPNTLKPFFQKSKNLALRGLFWLSKDLYEKGQDFDTVIEPEAQEIAFIRNYIEHKAFKVVSDFFPYPDHFDESKDIAYCISRGNLERKTLKLLKMTRAAIIYVSLAIDKEESNKDYNGLRTMPVSLNEISHKNKF
jgi:hypothetical protein